MSVVDQPKSILKKKSQFDREFDTYLRIKPVKSIRFSLDSNKSSRKNSPTGSNISINPKIIKSNQRKSEKKRRHRNDANESVGENTEKSHKQDKSRKPKKSFREGHGGEKEKTQGEKNKEETQPKGNVGNSLIVKSGDKLRGEDSEEVKETKEKSAKKEEETVEKVTKKRRRRRRRKHKRQPKE